MLKLKKLKQFKNRIIKKIKKKKINKFEKIEFSIEFGSLDSLNLYENNNNEYHFIDLNVKKEINLNKELWNMM